MGLGESKKEVKTSKSIQTQSQTQTQELKQNVSYANQKQMESNGDSVPISPELIDHVSDTKTVEEEKQNLSYSVTETKLHTEQKAQDVIGEGDLLKEEMSELDSMKYGSYNTKDVVKEDVEDTIKEYSFDGEEYDDLSEDSDEQMEMNYLDEEMVAQKRLARKIEEENDPYFKRKLERKDMTEEEEEQFKKRFHMDYGDLEKALENLNDPIFKSSENFKRVKMKLINLLRKARIKHFDEAERAMAFSECYQEAVKYYNEHRGHRFTSAGKRRKDAVNDLISLLQKKLLDEEFPNDVRVLVLHDMISNRTETGYESKKTQEFFNGEGQSLLEKETKDCNTPRLNKQLRVRGVYDKATVSQMEYIIQEKREDRIRQSEYKDLLSMLYRFDWKNDGGGIYVNEVKKYINELIMSLDGSETLIIDKYQEEYQKEDAKFTESDFDKILDEPIMDQLFEITSDYHPSDRIISAEKVKSSFLNCYRSANFMLQEYKNSSNKNKVRRRNDAEDLLKMMDQLIDKLPLLEEEKDEISKRIKEDKKTDQNIVENLRRFYEES